MRKRGRRGEPGAPTFTCGWRGGGGYFDILGRWVFGWVVGWLKVCSGVGRVEVGALSL